MGRAFICLGSNIAPERNLPAALAQLRARLEVTAVSSAYRSPAVGSPGAPDFCNAAVAVATGLSPRALKYEVLRPIEAALGRVRGTDKNAPRTIDLDLALYGALVLDDPMNGLRLPDPGVLTEPHLAEPLAEIAPELRHPESGQTLAEIAAGLRAGSQLVRMDSFDWGPATTLDSFRRSL